MRRISAEDFKTEWTSTQWLLDIALEEKLEGILVKGKGEQRSSYAVISTDELSSSSDYFAGFQRVSFRLKGESDFSTLSELMASDEDYEFILKYIDSDLKKGGATDVVTYNDSDEKRLLNNMVLSAVDREASDIHIFSYEDNSAKIVIERFGLLDVWKRTTTQEADSMVNSGLTSFSADYKGLNSVNERVNCGMPLLLFRDGPESVAKVKLRVVRDMSDSGTHTVMRIARTGIVAKTMDELGIPSDIQKILKEIIAQNNGMLLVTGPTGHGKTTTLDALYAGVPEHRKIIYAADPVEGALGRDFVVCYSVDNRTEDRNYSKIIETSLRQAPKIIAIAEARTAEVLEKAFEVPLTGHFCGTTYHADDPFLALVRLINDGIPVHILASGVLKGIASQRLLRVLCHGCKKSHDHPVFGQTFVRNSSGCEQCQGWGVTGRVMVAEVLVLDDTVCQLIMDLNIPAIRKHAVAHGFISMADRAKVLIRRGEIDPYDALECVPGMFSAPSYTYPKLVVA